MIGALRRRKTRRGSESVVLADGVLAAMRAEAERGLPAETGGVLVGRRESGGRVVVVHATGPGPRALRTPTRFRRDGAYAQAEVDRLHAAHGGRADYVGEWHTHPAPVGPSGVDLAGMAWIGDNPSYRTAEPLLIILQRTRWRGWRPLAFRWCDGRLAPAPLRQDARP